MIRRHVLAVAMMALVAGCSSDDPDPEPAPPPTPIPPVAKSFAELCNSFTATALDFSAQQGKVEMKAASASSPERCVVRGHIVSSSKSTINWTVELVDPKTWNGKTVTLGGGGFDGYMPLDGGNPRSLGGLGSAPYALMASDSGHQDNLFSFAWAQDNPIGLLNHAYEANHKTLTVGTQIVTQFYGKAPTRRYMLGQSNGGRAGLVSAQRYPKDYDGVVSMEPAIAQEGFAANVGYDLMKFIQSSPDHWLSPAQIELFAKAETRACDSLDGLADGIIGNFAGCTYIPTDLLCTGASNDTCLTTGQIDTVRKIYSDRTVPVVMADNAVGYPRFGRGGAQTSDWSSYLFGQTPDELAGGSILASQIFKIVEGNQAATLESHDPTRWSGQYLALSSLIDATNPDLAAYAEKGGKILFWYGVGDSLVSMYRLTQYLETVEAKLGTAKTRSFIRHLTTPNIGHNMDGPNGSSVAINLIGALDAWVEKGEAPDAVIGTWLDKDGNVTGTRPTCEYPKFPRYKGTGDATKAENFTCSLN
jgi:feruloyl esterase